MSRESIFVNRCDGCGSEVNSDQSDQPKQWIGVEVFSPMLASETDRARMHYCGNCASRILTELYASPAVSPMSENDAPTRWSVAAEWMNTGAADMLEEIDAVDPLRQPGILHIPEDGLARLESKYQAAKAAAAVETAQDADSYGAAAARGKAAGFRESLALILSLLGGQDG